MQSFASFPLANKIQRLVWNFVYFILFRPSPDFMYFWRVFLLRIFGAQIGPNCKIFSSVKVWLPRHLLMEGDSTIAPGANIYNMAMVKFMRGSIVSQYATLCTGSHDYTKSSLPLLTASIVLEPYVWICSEAFILPGVTIGEGAVVGCRSVVTTSQPPWMVCAGNPCRPLKKRDYS
jgi:putative colanic acid biosynthesis acetyltransferase WcaF